MPVINPSGEPNTPNRLTSLGGLPYNLQAAAMRLSAIEVIIKRQTDRQGVFAHIGEFSLYLFVSSRYPTRGIRKNLPLIVLPHPTRTGLYLVCLSLVFQHHRPSNDIPVLGAVSDN